MSVTMPDVAETRAAMLVAYRDALRALIEEATQKPGDVVEDGELVMNLGDWDGVPVVTRKRLDQAVGAVFGQPIPAPSETTVEVSTPATVIVSAVCPRCSIAQLISMSVHPELLVSDEGSELRIKAKAKARTHICGQLPLPVGEDEQTEIIETIESLVERVHGLLAETLDEDVPTLETIASWDRATVDQVDRWATARLAANGEHPETCSARFATDGTTGERICDCGLAEAVPPLPRVLGGDADPEPIAEDDVVEEDEGEELGEADDEGDS